MLYIAYLDEFGHIGPYLSHDDTKHKTHPVFGLGGIVLPADKVRSFSTFFFQLKNDLLSYELQTSGIHPAKWEKKGSSLYTYRNVRTYRRLLAETFRLLNHIKEVNGFIFYVGIEKKKVEEGHNSKEFYHSVLKETIKRLDQEFKQTNDSFMLILDQQEGNQLRSEIVEIASIEMHGNNRFRLIEPPIQAESHLYQTIQCADWLCGILGRLTSYQFEKEAKPELEIFEKYFSKRIEMIQRRSGIRPCKDNLAT